MGEPAGDRMSDEAFVMIDDCRTPTVGVGLEVGADRNDGAIRKADLETDLHVVHRERFRIAGHKQPGGLLITERAIDQKVAILEQERFDPVLTVMKDRHGTLGRTREDRVGSPVDIGGNPFVHGSPT